MQDYYNLVDVYLDAVLQPRCVTDPQTFAQEGWHYELDDAKVSIHHVHHTWLDTPVNKTNINTIWMVLAWYSCLLLHLICIARVTGRQLVCLRDRQLVPMGKAVVVDAASAIALCSSLVVTLLCSSCVHGLEVAD